jgi:hypothetical protein
MYQYKDIYNKEITKDILDKIDLLDKIDKISS